MNINLFNDFLTHKQLGSQKIITNYWRVKI